MSRGGSFNADCQEFFKESKQYISKQSKVIIELEKKLEELSDQRFDSKVALKGLRIIWFFQENSSDPANLFFWCKER